MEACAQSVDDNLIDSLSFKLRPGATYVTDRRNVSFFFPLGGNHYTSNGVRVIKISLNGDQWLDPSTVKLFYTIQNTTSLTEKTELVPLIAGPWGLFRRMRVICGGQIVEDFDNYNRTHERIHIIKSTEKRITMASKVLVKPNLHKSITILRIVQVLYPKARNKLCALIL